MKLFLVTRGSQGDIYPYLVLAKALKERNHEVTLSLPALFEKHARNFGLNYVLQAYDDIEGMIEGAAETKQKTRFLLQWTRRVIDKQFEEFIPILEKNDVLISANTEFAAASVAEYCKKPIIRTAFAPLIPGTQIPPPVMPWPEVNRVFTPKFLWKLLNKSTNFMVLKTLNKNRVKRGLPPVKNFGIHAANAGHNYLMYSRHVGNTDPTWECKWNIGGYCFNDNLAYEKASYEELLAFIKKDKKPTIFFTLGSCSSKNKNRICQWLLDLCKKHDYKLIVGSGWARTGTEMKDHEYLFLMDKPIPHSIVFSECDAVIHHGGCGTTHSAARAGRPQLVLPILLDQNYWGNRVFTLGVGPDRLKISNASFHKLEAKVCDLINCTDYKENAAILKEKIKEEDSIQNICNFIESIHI